MQNNKKLHEQNINLLTLCILLRSAFDFSFEVVAIRCSSAI